MVMWKSVGAILSVVLLLSSQPVIGTPFRELMWQDLIPRQAMFNDPFAEMDREQLEYLGFVARVRMMKELGREISRETLAEADELERELSDSGIDVDGLIAQRENVRALREKQAGAIVDSLDATSIRIPGYLLPLDFSNRTVTEFLLVPWVGACIHTPPPPPNQIVHVVLEAGNGYESRSIYEPVWVSGELFTRAVTRNLFLNDGSSDISIGYRLNAVAVETYKKL